MLNITAHKATKRCSIESPNASTSAMVLEGSLVRQGRGARQGDAEPGKADIIKKIREQIALGHDINPKTLKKLFTWRKE